MIFLGRRRCPGYPSPTVFLGCPGFSRMTLTDTADASAPYPYMCPRHYGTIAAATRKHARRKNGSSPRASPVNT